MFLKANKYPTPKLTLSQHKSSMKTQANNRTDRTLRPHANKTIDDPPRSIQSLLDSRAIWRASHTVRHHSGCLSSGYRQLDQALPNHGWPVAGATELLLEQSGIGELQIVTPALARLSQHHWQWIVWIAPPHTPYAPALLSAGINLNRILIITPPSPKEALWAAEQCVQSEACSAILFWPENNIRPQAIKRLQVASQSTRTWAIIFREAATRAMPSPSPLRITLSSNNTLSCSDQPKNQRCLQVEIFKRPGGWPLPPFTLDLPLSSGKELDIDMDFNLHSDLDNQGPIKSLATQALPLSPYIEETFSVESLPAQLGTKTA